MTRPLRILQVCDLFEPFIGGMEQHVRTLAQGLAQREHEVTVATAHLPGTSFNETVDGFRIRRITGWSGRALASRYEQADAPFHPPVPDPGVVAALKQIIKELRPDIIHAQGWITYSCLAVTRRQRLPLVVTLHDGRLACARMIMMRNGLEVCSGPRLAVCMRCAHGQYGMVKGAALTVGLRAVRPLHGRVESWIAISRSIADSSRCAVPRGTLISVIPPCSAQTPTLGQRPDWLPADGYALFVGALGHHKGLNWLLDAYAGGEFRHPLVVVGTTQRDTPRAWPTGVVVRTDVPHQEVMEAWRHAEIGVVPSLCPEGFGLAAVEAMRSGVPIVASRIGALPEIVTDGITGILVTPGNTTELRTAIRRLDKDPVLRKRMGAAGLAQAQKFSAEIVIGLYEQHYHRLLARRPDAPRDLARGLEGDREGDSIELADSG
jgi:glycosyltransferase involved in cell wall biosynthesis